MGQLGLGQFFVWPELRSVGLGLHRSAHLHQVATDFDAGHCGLDRADAAPFHFTLELGHGSPGAST
jgi:hypothetical protein